MMHVKVSPWEWSKNEPRQVRGSGLDDLRRGSWPEREDESIYGAIFSTEGERPFQMGITTSGREIATLINNRPEQNLGREE